MSGPGDLLQCNFHAFLRTAFRAMNQEDMLAYPQNRPSQLRTVRTHSSGFRVRSHSQMRTILHPRCSSSWFTRRSLARVFATFSRQTLAFVLGVTFRPQSCPCQKHPSTNTASFSLGHTKSGLPVNRWCLRQPLKPDLRNRHARRLSVVKLSRRFTRDISSPRRKPPNVVRSCCASPGQRVIAHLPHVERHTPEVRSTPSSLLVLHRVEEPRYLLGRIHSPFYQFQIRSRRETSEVELPPEQR